MKKYCYESKYALCPFYHYEDSQKISCEGVTDRSTLHVVFGEEHIKEEFEKKYCYTCYTDCKVYRMLLSKYEVRDDVDV